MALYKKIADQIESGINRGTFKPGEKIPSIRHFAAEFGCSKLTVQKAFDLLKSRNCIENIVGSGSYVRFPERINRTGDIFDFKTAYLSESFFPYRKAQKIFTTLFDEQKAGIFSTPPVEGDPELIETLGEFYRVPTRRMLIISGAQQGLDLTAKVFSSGISENILFEDPTYPGAISLFKAKHFVPLETDGPDIKALDAMLPAQIRLFYTMPTVHNPTGISYNLEKKEQIARRARRHPFYIIEDDYLSEYHESPAPRFVDLFPEKTIYIKSLSQTTVSGIRLGFMIVPEDLYEKFLYTKYTSDIASAGLIQKFVREFIQTGAFEAYLEKTAKKIHHRRQQVLDLVNAAPGLSVQLPQHGCSLWVRTNGTRVPANQPWNPGREFSFSPEYHDCFRLSFMNLDDSKFDRALEYLQHTFSRMDTPLGAGSEMDFEAASKKTLDLE
ncbi:MAG: PLP-dependent aminotransferase family protein [Desulfobacterales bacterium]|nr:PLP-dependent aminotransferase family protein [Desulfobacterales bacterium]